MSLPTDEEIGLVKNQLLVAIQHNVYVPGAALLPEDHNILARLHVEDPLASSVLLDQLKDYARTKPDPWSDAKIKEIDRIFVKYEKEAKRKIAEWEKAAKKAERERENAERAANRERRKAEIEANRQRLLAEKADKKAWDAEKERVKAEREAERVRERAEREAALKRKKAERTAEIVTLSIVRNQAKAEKDAKARERDAAKARATALQRKLEKQNEERLTRQAGLAVQEAALQPKLELVEAPPNADDLTPDEMIETNSKRLVAIGTLLKYRPGRVWYDDFYKRPYTDWRGEMDQAMIEPMPMDDAQVGRIVTWLQSTDERLGKANDKTLIGAIDYVVDRTHRNAPVEWLDGLEWDGVERLESLFVEAFGAPVTVFNKNAGRCWFISMIARLRDPGCKVDTMPVLCGGQGALKSQALEIIGGPWYRAASSNIDAKDFLQELHGALVFEVPELHSMISSKHGSARIKAVLSTRVDHFRTPYGRLPMDHKRTAVLAGTTNNADWHTDDTGGRRFWPVHVGVVQLDWLKANREQLFAEARQRYLAGDKWWDVPDKEQRELIEAERPVDAWEEMIAVKLDDISLYDGGFLQPNARWSDGTTEQSDWGNVVTVQRVAIQWLRFTSEMLGRHSRRIAVVLRRLGWEQKRSRVPGAIHARIHWLPKEPEERMTFLTGVEPRPVAAEDDTETIPF